MTELMDWRQGDLQVRVARLPWFDDAPISISLTGYYSHEMTPSAARALAAKLIEAADLVDLQKSQAHR